QGQSYHQRPRFWRRGGDGSYLLLTRAGFPAWAPRLERGALVLHAAEAAARYPSLKRLFLQPLQRPFLARLCPNCARTTSHHAGSVVRRSGGRGVSLSYPCNGLLLVPIDAPEGSDLGILWQPVGVRVPPVALDTKAIHCAPTTPRNSNREGDRP